MSRLRACIGLVSLGACLCHNTTKLTTPTQEVNSRYADRHKILRFTSKRVTRKYSFEMASVPHESEYLQVRYSTDYPPPQVGDTGHTFSHVFGTNTSR